MPIGDRIRNMLRSFLRIEQAPTQSFTISEQLDYNATAFMHRLWYRGAADELAQFYRQLSDVNCTFWGAVPTKGLEMRRIHTGIPKEMVKKMADIVARDLNEITMIDTKKKELWDSIVQENNNMPALIWRAVKDALVIGDGVFKISLDPTVSKLPIIEWFPGDDIELIHKRGRLEEIIFISRYNKYTLREHYGRGFVRYELRDDEHEVPLDTVKELAGLQNVKFSGDFIMAVPFRIAESERWPGRGESIFTGKEGNFDALDEAWSQWIHAMRSCRPKSYIPESLIPRDPEHGDLLRPNPFDNQFIKLEGGMGENSTQKAELVQPSFISGEYSTTLNAALDFALQGIISPSTLGIDVKKLDNAEAQREKEKTTLYTRNQIIDCLSKALRSLVNITLKVEALCNNRAADQTNADVIFGEYANPSFEAVVEVMSNPNTPMSIEAKVDELWGDSKDTKWKEKEVARIKEQQGIVSLAEPALSEESGLNG